MEFNIISYFCSVLGWTRLILHKGKSLSLVGLNRMCFALIFGFGFICKIVGRSKISVISEYLFY